MYASLPMIRGHTFLRLFRIVLEHVWRDRQRSNFPGIQCVRFPLLLDVNGHQETPADSHALHIDETIAKHCGDGSVHRGSILFQNFSKMWKFYRKRILCLRLVSIFNYIVYLFCYLLVTYFCTILNYFGR